MKNAKLAIFKETRKGSGSFNFLIISTRLRIVVNTPIWKHKKLFALKIDPGFEIRQMVRELF